jgi:NADP-dependent 3-hydroxy acid dehydrogenase YdfG
MHTVRKEMAMTQQRDPRSTPPAGSSVKMSALPKASQSSSLQDVRGKTAYVSAASDGIGLGIARAFSNAGMNVVIGYRDDDRLAKALLLFERGAPVLPVKHDVVGIDGWLQMLKAVKNKYGNLHVVVNNAGMKTLRMATDATPEEWQSAMDVNCGAIYYSLAAILPHMKEHKEGGHFVTTASMSGLLPAVTAGVYTATKFAAVGIMEALRIELEGTNIGTSVFCPGGVNTDNQPSGLWSSQKLRANPNAAFEAMLMDPLEAGERVLNGIRNNDLFILSHPEFRDGIQERFDSILASFTDEAVPQGRLRMERLTCRTAIYPRETEHRMTKRKSYRG